MYKIDMHTRVRASCDAKIFNHDHCACCLHVNVVPNKTFVVVVALATRRH